MKLIATVIAATAVAAAGLSTALAEPPKAGKGSKLVVQDLEARGVERHEAAALATAACNAIASRPKYAVLCGDDLRAMMKWNAIATSFDACKDEACVQRTAKAMEARFVVSGSVAKVGESFVLSLAMLDVEQGTSLGRAEVKAQTVDGLYDQVPEAIDVLLSGRKG